MTREDVRAQLAKNPLKWKNHEGLTPGTMRYYAGFYFGHGKVEYDIHIDDECDESTLAFCVNNDSEYIDVEGSLSELKTIAETHRIDLICRLLNIED